MPAKCHEYLWIERAHLIQQKWCARCLLFLGRIAILGWPALVDTGNEDPTAGQSSGLQAKVKVLSSRPAKGSAGFVFIAAWGFTDAHDPCGCHFNGQPRGIGGASNAGAFPRHGLDAIVCQWARSARAALCSNLTQRLQVWVVHEMGNVDAVLELVPYSGIITRKNFANAISSSDLADPLAFRDSQIPNYPRTRRALAHLRSRHHRR